MFIFCMQCGFEKSSPDFISTSPSKFNAVSLTLCAPTCTSVIERILSNTTFIFLPFDKFHINERVNTPFRISNSRTNSEISALEISNSSPSTHILVYNQSTELTIYSVKSTIPL